MTTETQTTRVNRSVDLKCELKSQNPADGLFKWFLNGREIDYSPVEQMTYIEQ